MGELPADQFAVLDPHTLPGVDENAQQTPLTELDVDQLIAHGRKRTLRHGEEVRRCCRRLHKTPVPYEEKKMGS
jgi:hypothetical protein